MELRDKDRRRKRVHTSTVHLVYGRRYPEYPFYYKLDMNHIDSTGCFKVVRCCGINKLTQHEFASQFIFPTKEIADKFSVFLNDFRLVFDHEFVPLGMDFTMNEMAKLKNRPINHIIDVNFKNNRQHGN